MYVHVDQATVTSHYNAFRNNFPDVTTRLEAAQSLASTDVLLPPDPNHPSQNLLVAHWGEEDPRIRDLAEHIFAVKCHVDKHVGQQVAIVRKGVLGEVTDPHTEISKDITLDLGVVAESQIEHGFLGNPSERGPWRLGIRPPYLGFASMLTLRDRQRVVVDVVDGMQVTQVGVEPGPVVVYSGTVPLKPDLPAYEAEKVIKKPPLIFGTARCVSIVESLHEKTKQLLSDDA